jgi:hypothetical protein
MATETRPDKYIDPSNVQEILDELNNIPTMGGVNALIESVFPDWKVMTLTGFCENYPHLTNNWNILCKRIGIPPTQIVIVRELSFDDDHLLLRNFVECLTRSGFAVKKMDDYFPCSKCEVIAVPTPHIHNLMKDKDILVPEINIPVCKACR